MPLCDALEQLEALQAQVQQPTPAEASSPRRNRQLQHYEIQSTAAGQFLVEHRPGHSQPFRCPRETYDAAAAVLAASDEPQHFEQLMEQLNARMAQRQPDYRLRVALRFWIAQGVAARFRTRYRAGDRAAFPEVTRNLWDSLARVTAAPPPSVRSA